MGEECSTSRTERLWTAAFIGIQLVTVWSSVGSGQGFCGLPDDPELPEGT